MSKRSPRHTVVAALVFLTMGLAAPRAAALDDAAASTTSAPADAVAAPPLVAPPPAIRRPVLLSPLYVSFVALQALDVNSTLAAIHRGGMEANPVMSGAVGSPAALVAIKSVSAACLIFASERLWRQHRLGAVLMMVGLDTGYAMVAAHNYGVARQMP
jgi:hypothetical protein